MKFFTKHHELEPHQKYQLEVIFLFTVLIMLYVPYFLVMDEFGWDKQTWQWHFFWPLTIIFVAYSLNMRDKIRPDEMVNPLKRPIMHWLLLGLLIIMYHLQPLTLMRLQSFDLMFIIFTLFLADSYWDFKTLKLKK